MGFRGSGFRVWGLGFRGSGFRGSGSGFLVGNEEARYPFVYPILAKNLLHGLHRVLKSHTNNQKAWGFRA